jgi:sugar/nucleoside kinase (ribokinase family)
MATRDHIVLVDKYPTANERVVALQSVRAIGGPATTAAVTMARLGVDVSLACVIGDDDDGRFIFDTLKREGVDIRNVVVNPEIHTAIGTIVVSKSEHTRAIMVQPHEELPAKPANINDYEWVHVDQFGMKAIKDWGEALYRYRICNSGIELERLRLIRTIRKHHYGCFDRCA